MHMTSELNCGSLWLAVLLMGIYPSRNVGRDCLVIGHLRLGNSALGLANSIQYHPTSGLMQILQFDWLWYQMTINNSHRVAKLAQSSATLSFVLLLSKDFFNFHLLTLLLPFLSDQLGDTKTIRPFALKGNWSIAHSASPYFFAKKINPLDWLSSKCLFRMYL